MEPPKIMIVQYFHGYVILMGAVIISYRPLPTRLQHGQLLGFVFLQIAKRGTQASQGMLGEKLGAADQLDSL